MASIIDKVKEKLEKGQTSKGEHAAAILSSKGVPVAVGQRKTPQPGPNELLIEVKAFAFNPVDVYQRDFGFMVAQYPAVLGSDVGGVVISVGSSVTGDMFKPGTRVTAFATSFYAQGSPDHGGMQELVLVPSANVSPLPENIGFKEAALLPMAVQTSWAAMYTNGIPRSTSYSAADKQGMLIWGGATSIASAGIQIAKLLGFTVYTTASTKHHDYLKRLGATRTFDYKSANVEDEIVQAVKNDGVTINYGYDAAGALESCLRILKQTKGVETAHLASAIPLNDDSPTLEGVERKFVEQPADEGARTEQFTFIFNTWLNEKLEKGQIVPSPAIKVIPGGLESAQKAMDELKGGVSGTKLMIEI